MTARVRASLASLLALGSLGACRSGSGDSTSPVTEATDPVEVVVSSVVPTGAQPEDTTGGGAAGTVVSNIPTTSVTAVETSQPANPTTTVVVTLPVDADVDELVLSDGFSDEGDPWAETTWEVDLPGEAAALVIDGLGVMATDARGTHEWVRALAPGSTHDNASLRARVTPIRSDEGTVFVGLRGDGEWRDAAPYLPQTGVAVEYSYAEAFLGEVVLIVLDGPDEHRIGPVSGPILSDGESANIRVDVIEGRAHAKVWRVGTDEPSDWALEADIEANDGGIVQISYRDTVEQSVAWDALTLQLLP